MARYKCDDCGHVVPFCKCIPAVESACSKAKVIWKFALQLEDRQVVMMPKKAEILSVQAQGPTLCLWAGVDPGEEPEQRVIEIVGTGHPMDDSRERVYLDTAQMCGGTLVWHIFELM